MIRFKPVRIFLDRSSEKDDIALQLLYIYDDVPVVTVESEREVIEEAESAEDPIGYAKECLYLRQNKGAKIVACPGTKAHICCGYKILDIATGCGMDCSYCILQSFLNNHVVTIYTNLEETEGELKKVLNAGRSWRIGTGEFTDSLFAESLILISRRLVPHFKGRRNAVLELKTKSDNVNDILDLGPSDRIIIAFSVNTEELISTEEKGATTLLQRINAAVRAAEAGFKVAFHFDPLIEHHGWPDNYRKVVHEIFSLISPRDIVWISLGCLRFPPKLREIIRERHPGSHVLNGEFVRGADGKLRYFRPIREEMYTTLLHAIRSYDKEVLVYLCMESELVWKRVFGFSPLERGGLPRMLDEACGIV